MRFIGFCFITESSQFLKLHRILSVGNSFIPWRAKVLNFDETQFVSFFISWIVLWCQPNLGPPQIFLLHKFYINLAIACSVCHPFQVNDCVWCEVREGIFLDMGYSVVPVQPVEKTILSLLNYLDTFVANQLTDHKHMGLISHILIHPSLCLSLWENCTDLLTGAL